MTRIFTRSIVLASAILAVMAMLFIQERVQSKEPTPVCLYAGSLYKAPHTIPSGMALGEPIAIYVTSYNPEEGQTDSSPCSGASGRDLCLAASEGDRTIALSRDLLRYYGLGGTYQWRDKVLLQSPSLGCNGVFSVEDTMNDRFSLRADIFEMNRKDNVGLCTDVTIQPFTF